MFIQILHLGSAEEIMEVGSDELIQRRKKT
jgi:hypothetical protein